MKIKIALPFCVALILSPAFAQSERPSMPATSLIARVGATGFVEVKANSFHSLSPKQQALSYWLTQASIAVDPIIYDQLSGYGLREKRLLEEIVAHPAGIEPKTMTRITEFTRALLGQPGKPQRRDRPKVPAAVHLR